MWPCLHTRETLPRLQQVSASGLHNKLLHGSRIKDSHHMLLSLWSTRLTALVYSNSTYVISPAWEYPWLVKDIPFIDWSEILLNRQTKSSLHRTPHKKKKKKRVESCSMYLQDTSLQSIGSFSTPPRRFNHHQVLVDVESASVSLQVSCGKR